MTESDASGLSTAQLVQNLADQVGALVRAELNLARAEMVSKTRRLAVGVGLLGLGAALAVFAAATLVATVVLALAEAMPAWAAALITAVALVLVAGLAVLMGRSALRRAAPPIPTQTLGDVQQDLVAVKAAVRGDHGAQLQERG